MLGPHVDGHIGLGKHPLCDVLDLPDVIIVRNNKITYKRWFLCVKTTDLE